MSGISDTREAMLTKLAESGLSDADTIRALGMAPKVNGEAQQLTGYDAPGFMIPYFDIEGHRTTFYRFRILGKSKNKYLQPKGSGVSVYFPPLTDWPALIKDTARGIIITEGELKAACATKLGFHTLGLGGVWSFKNKVKEQDLIPDLMQIEWKGRNTYICYDSDAATNSKVTQAECELATKLDSLGAIVYILRLPKLPRQSKTGLDDYLMHPKAGIKGFTELVRKAEKWAGTAALSRFNNEVIFINDPGVVVKRDTGQRIDTRSLVGGIYANRKYMKPSPTADDPLRRKEASVPVDWLQWSGRACAERMTYMPGKPEMAETSPGKFEFNMWRGWGTKPKKGVITPWRDLLDYIFKDAAPGDRTWFEQWCAYPIQFPGTKMYTAVVIWSAEQGTGKSLVGYTLGRIYGDNFAEIGDQDLASSFNAFSVNKQFILGDEITGNGGGEKRQIANKLKSMITQERVTVNQKYVPTYTIPDCINYLWTSNHCDAFFLENADRRYFVIEIKGKPLSMDFYRRTYDPWYRSDKGINALHFHLLNLDLTGFDPQGHARMTDSKRAMIEDTRSEVADWVMSLPSMKGIKTLMTSEEILQIAQGQGKFNWSKNLITKAMKDALYVRPLGDIQQLVLPDRQVRPWLINKTLPIAAKPSQKLMRELWDQDRQPMPEPKFKKK